MRYYTYGYEDYKGNEGEITVKANNKKEALERTSDYEVNKGEIHYVWLLNSSETGTEKYYQSDNRSLTLFVGLMGAALGCHQIGMYGVKRNYLNALKDKETMFLIEEKD